MRIEAAAIDGAVVVIVVEMLEAECVRVVRDLDVIGYIIAEVQPGHLRSGEGGAVAPIFQLVVVDVGNIPDLFIVDGIVVGVIDGDEGGRILYVNEVVFIRTVVDGDVIAAVVLVVIEVVLRVIVLVEGSIVVVIRRVVVVPGLKVCAVGIVVCDVVRGIAVQEVR